MPQESLITAVFGRTESKDFVDLYFLLKYGLDFQTLVEHAKEKDSGLTDFWLAGMLRQVQNLNFLPEMLAPLDLETLKAFFLELADEQFREIKPPD